MLILSHSDVARVFSMERALEAVRRGAAEYSGGQAAVPPRVRVDVAEGGGSGLFMPGYLPRVPAYGLKVVGGFAGNRARGLHPSYGTVLLLEPDSGRAAALLDGTHLTDQRTGAMSGVACEYLARRDAAVLGLIGSGAQARTQLDAVIATCPIREARVYSRSAENVARFAREAAARHPGVEVRAAASAEAAVRGADVVVAATTAREPVVLDAWVEPGMLVCSAGSNRPHLAELEPATVGRAARVAVDTRRGTLEGVGDLALPIAAGLLDEGRVVELGELVLGLAPGRRSDDELAVFKSVGFAAVDLVAAALIVEAARAQGLGWEIDLHA